MRRPMNVLRKRAISFGFATVPVAPREATARDMGDRGTIERALRGDGVAVRVLVELLTPAIQTSIARAVLIVIDREAVSLEDARQMRADDPRVLRARVERAP